MRLVEVHWIDAAFNLDHDPIEVGKWVKNGGMPGITVGWVLHDTKKCVIVYAEQFEDGTYRGLTVIPKGMVTKIVER